MWQARTCVRCMLERWNAHACEIARTRHFVRVRRVARSHPYPAFDLESAEARALEHALLLGCGTCKCTLFSFQLPVYKLSPTFLSAFNRTDITDNTTTASRTGRRGREDLSHMQAMAEGREENIAAAMNNSEKVRWLYYLLVCLFIFLSPTCWRRRRD